MVRLELGFGASRDLASIHKEPSYHHGGARHFSSGSLIASFTVPCDLNGSTALFLTTLTDHAIWWGKTCEFGDYPIIGTTSINQAYQLPHPDDAFESPVSPTCGVAQPIAKNDGL